MCDDTTLQDMKDHIEAILLRTISKNGHFCNDENRSQLWQELDFSSKFPVDRKSRPCLRRRRAGNFDRHLTMRK